LETVRIIGSFDDHVVSLVTSLTVPSENVAVAVNWLVSPTDARTRYQVDATRDVILERSGAE
jgi:hypothetical protein